MYAYGPSHLFKATILYEDIQQCRLTETPLFCTKTDSPAWEAWKWSEVAQSCPTLFNPVDCSPPGSSVHGILQARILEWVAISFSSAWKWKLKVKSQSLVRLLATPWTSVHQAPPSMGFSRQECWSGVPLPSPTPFIVIIKYWLYSPCCTIYPYSLFYT